MLISTWRHIFWRRMLISRSFPQGYQQGFPQGYQHFCLITFWAFCCFLFIVDIFFGCQPLPFSCLFYVIQGRCFFNIPSPFSVFLMMIFVIFWDHLSGCKRYRFALQKVSFQSAICGLLQCKRCPFGTTEKCVDFVWFCSFWCADLSSQRDAEILNYSDFSWQEMMLFAGWILWFTASEFIVFLIEKSWLVRLDFSAFLIKNSALFWTYLRHVKLEFCCLMESR